MRLPRRGGKTVRASMHPEVPVGFVFFSAPPRQLHRVDVKCCCGCGPPFFHLH